MELCDSSKEIVGIIFARCLNKYLVHADHRFSEINTEISVKILDEFIDDLEKYINQI